MNKRLPKKLVLDASIALKWFLKPEKDSEQAVSLFKLIEEKKVNFPFIKLLEEV